ncbi:unnamed protein product [Sphagnum balticum]
MSSRAALSISEGYPNTNPITPPDISGTSTLAVITVPPYPSLSANAAAIYDRYDYAVSVQPTQNRRYTMKDIGTLDSRISTLEYYTSLSLLETAANNLLITSNTTGANRFKNGFLVDSFDNFSVSDTTDSTFNIAIDAGASEIRPAFNVSAFDLTINNASSVGVSQVGEVTILNYNTTSYVTQPYASQYRNCIQSNLYDWVGVLTISPTADTTVDYTSEPTVTVTDDDTANWVNLANAWGTQWDSWQDVATVSSSASSTVANSTQSSTYTTTTTNTTQQQTGTQLVVTGTTSSTQTVGTFITSIGVSPYVRANLINFYGTGLKPSTNIYAYFADTNVSQYCYPANSATLDVNGNYLQTGAIGAQLVTDANGNVSGCFMIPSGTFNVGTLIFKLCDIANLSTGSNDITTAATATYVADDISASTATVQLTTREATVALQTVSETRVVTTDTTALTGVSVIASPTSDVGSSVSGDSGSSQNSQGPEGEAEAGGGQGSQGEDPIGQTFVINEPTGGVAVKWYIQHRNWYRLFCKHNCH